MTPSRWQEIERLHDAVLERPPAERAAFLAEACGGDKDLCRIVDSLLAQDRSKAVTMEGFARTAEAGLTGGDSTVTVVGPGTRLGPYKIEAPLGKGGMGEVFRAVDTRLGRPVAIKISQVEFGERFEREARAISALNHPHICTLYDVGPNYLVMELCEGETLAARLKRGKLSIEEALRYGAEIAGALSAAHAKGIVHRDLKPHNVMLGKAGIKVLDFGLAKSTQDETLTASRVVMGTPAYMAPEQREGKECDARTDIYALGLVVYEMATGKRAVQEQAPPLDQLPDKLAHVIERCVAQEPDERWQSARDVRAVLEWALRKQPAAISANGKRRWLPVAIGCVVVAVLVGAGVWTRAKSAIPGEPVKFSFEPSAGTSLLEYTGVTSVVLSPDGRRIAFVVKEGSGTTALWTRSLESEEPQRVAGTDGASSPFWSPDGQFLGYFAEGKLRKIALAGGPPQNICSSAPGLGATWNPAGEIVFNPTNRASLMRVAAAGGTPRQLTSLVSDRQENSHRWPSFLPDGRHFLFTARSSEKENTAIYVGSLDSTETKRILTEQSNAVFTSLGYLLFVRDGTLMAQRFDPGRLELSGEAFPIAANVQQTTPSAQASFTASAEGDVIAYSEAIRSIEQLTWFDRAGKTLREAGPKGHYTSPRISPDGKLLAMVIPDPESGNRDIWISDLSTGSRTRFTSNPVNDWLPVWSPDGKFIAFASDRTPKSSIFRKAVDGSGDEELLVPSLESGGAFSPDWSRDGQLVYQVDNGLGIDLWMMSLLDRKPHPFLATQFRERDPRFSPNSKGIAYESNESGAFEIYVTPVGRPGKQRVSTGGGRQPSWRPDGKEIFFVSGNMLMSAEVKWDEDSLSVSSPKSLFQTCPILSASAPKYDVAANGNKFLFSCQIRDDKKPSITIAIHWLDTPKYPGQKAKREP